MELCNHNCITSSTSGTEVASVSLLLWQVQCLLWRPSRLQNLPSKLLITPFEQCEHLRQLAPYEFELKHCSGSICLNPHVCLAASVISQMSCVPCIFDYFLLLPPLLQIPSNDPVEIKGTELATHNARHGTVLWTHRPKLDFWPTPVQTALCADATEHKVPSNRR